MAFANLTLRTLTPNIGTTKGAALTFSEMDTNLINLAAINELQQVAAGNVTLSATDTGKHYLDTSTAPITVTIPTNANVAFALGTVVSFVNQSTGNLTVVAPTGGSLWLAGNATSSNRTITSYGLATILKVGTDNWFINGNGVV